MKNIIDALNWRYATKIYDLKKKISPDNIEFLIESIRLSPSSYGLQTYRIIHVTNPEIREKLKLASWGQTQITDASDLFVFAVETNLNDTHVNNFIQKTATVRNMPIEELKEYEGIIKKTVNSLHDEEKINWASKQAYLALGILLESAALLHIDATPMEGFDASKYNQILDLDKLNLTSVVVAALGYRSEQDTYASLKKVRADIADLVIEK